MRKAIALVFEQWDRLQMKLTLDALLKQSECSGVCKWILIDNKDSFYSKQVYLVVMHGAAF